MTISSSSAAIKASTVAGSSSTPCRRSQRRSGSRESQRKLDHEQPWSTLAYLRILSFLFQIYPETFESPNTSSRINPKLSIKHSTPPPNWTMVPPLLVVFKAATNFVICKINLTSLPQTSQTCTLVSVRCKWTYKCTIKTWDINVSIWSDNSLK